MFHRLSIFPLEKLAMRKNSFVWFFPVFFPGHHISSFNVSCIGHSFLLKGRIEMKFKKITRLYYGVMYLLNMHHLCKGWDNIFSSFVPHAAPAPCCVSPWFRGSINILGVDLQGVCVTAVEGKKLPQLSHFCFCANIRTVESKLVFFPY